MYGGRESLKRDCHGHYFFSANVKRSDDQENLAARFMGLERKHNFQGYMMKFTPGREQEPALSTYMLCARLQPGLGQDDRRGGWLQPAGEGRGA